jgi:hypothetical protein
VLILGGPRGGLVKNVFRIPSGWRVVVQRAGEIHDRAFAVSTYGSLAKARKAAVEYRDSLVKKLPLPQVTTDASARSRSGVRGVFPVRASAGKRKRIVAYMASLSLPDGTRLRRRFLVGDEGAKAALAAATRYRDRELRKLLRQARKA